MNEIKTTIKQLRRDKGINQAQLAEQLHVTRQAVSNWENGKTQPDIETLTQIAEYFDVSVERLIYGKEKPRWHFSVKVYPEKVIELGMILAAVVSYVEWKSIGWAILHGLLNWGYILYFIIRY
jgi:transcriptional regulator with XRE-family HTH domain